MYKLIIIGRACDIPYLVDNLQMNCEIIQTITFHDNQSLNITFDPNVIALADFIIIACDNELSDDIYNSLINIDIIKDKVLDFYRIAHASLPRMTADRIMLNQAIPSYETVVLGLSHAEVGIIPSMMSKPTANLAIGGQDIYYNFENLKYCIEKYPQKFINLKNIIIDMFDYTYFNYDTSLSKNAITYFVKSGGILLAHNFDKNANMTTDFTSVLNDIEYYHYRRVTKNQVTIWDKIIDPDIFGAPSYKGYTTMPFITNRTNTFSPSDSNAISFLNTSLIHKKHKETIKENEILFRSLLEFLFCINPEMNIHLVLFPQHISSYQKDDDELMQWKEYFYNKLSEYQKDFKNISLHDYKYCDLSYDSNLFADIDHLNYEGAVIFTKMLDLLV